MSATVNAEFFSAIADIESEKGISQEYILDRIEQAMLAALRKDMPEAAEAAHVVLNPKKNTIDMYIERTVAEEPENPETEISLEAAREINKRYKAGDVVREEIDARKFGRIAAQAAKQVIIQGIREAERSMVYDEFTSKEHEILTGTITQVDPRTGGISIAITSNTEYTEALLPAAECIPGERMHEGGYIKVYVVEVRKATRGPQVLISRTHPGLVKKLFELEVPEISEGIVEIKSIAREPGSRTKISVMTNDPSVEPIGACVGPRGSRVNAVVDELNREKIDIVKYSEEIVEYISAALAPSDVTSVTLLDEKRSCRVIVPDSQLSLAIGKEGQNVRLAARLTGYKIDIKPQSQY
ncbi:MAG: transcription termination factor NusA [Oscillospiraceae bacterium]|jgi:N utilization substance protein A|nr:transcription termination factor NusA [Oscillospiraceae bacterium]